MNISIQGMLTLILKHETKKNVIKRLNCSRATLYRTLNAETVPNYDLGKAIENLYNEVVSGRKAG